MSKAIPSVSLVAALVACAAANPAPPPQTTTQEGQNMSAQTLETNKQAVVRLYEEYFNQGKSEAIRSLVASDYVGPGGVRGPEALSSIAEALHTGFPDIHYTVEDVIAEGDGVCVRWKWEGTHTGPFRDFAVTHKRFVSTGMGIFRLRDGKIVGSSIEIDRLGFLDQIGVIPPGLIPGPARKPSQ
jgi:predicted ester cyclase